jgi:NADPH2:quinone reductase
MKLETVADPSLGPTDVLIDVRAAGINPVDTYIRSGNYKTLPSYPYTPGSDAAGVIRAVGSAVTEVSVGDRVYNIGWGVGLGAYAELLAAPARSVARIPGNLTFAQAAAINVPYGTAFRALFDRARLAGGETVLVHGASGGVGMAAVQLAVAAGANVLATAGSQRGLDLVLEHGAVRAFDHRDPAYLDEIRRAAPNGVDVVIENLANVNLDKDLDMLAMFGRIVVVGCRGAVEVHPRTLLLKDAVVYGMALANATPADLARIHASLRAGLRQGTLKPVVGRELPLAEAAQGHHAVLEPGAHGKIVLVP